MARAGQLLGRVVAAGLLGATAGIHAYLWNVGYRNIPDIGRLFLLDAVAGSLLCLGVLSGFKPRWVAAAGAVLELGTLVGLVLATRRGLFGFTESTRATLYWQSVVVEAAGAAVLLVLVLVPGRPAVGARRVNRAGPAAVKRV